MRQTLCSTAHLFHHVLFGFAYSFHCVVDPIVQVAQSEVRLSRGMPTWLVDAMALRNTLSDRVK